jgi:hypothetical protein
MRTLSVLCMVFAVSFAQCAEPKLTKELSAKVKAGIGKLTEKDVLKLVPGSVKIELPSLESRLDNDSTPCEWILKWEEATSIQVSLIDGKVVSATFETNDTVVSKVLTLDNFKRIKTGMTQAELEKALPSPSKKSSSGNKTNCRWSQGRRLAAYILDGYVIGYRFSEGPLR